MDVDIFDQITLKLFTKLTNLKNISNVQLFSRPNLKMSEIERWEYEHKCELPLELKQIYQFSNGFTVKWDYKYNNETLELGCFHLNGLDELTIIDLPSQLRIFDNIDSLENNEGMYCPSGIFVNLDSVLKEGIVALHFKNDGSTSVAFRDNSCRWFQITDSFAKYFRLLCVHLGLPGWLNGYTKSGINPRLIPFYKLIIPERLKILQEKAVNGLELNTNLPSYFSSQKFQKMLKHFHQKTGG
eukprot:TRINITY_DN3137_c0_g2_i1.p1 TRINITY_DN3137_c0_g2~~TRINITY_DN3137_c0_g2_i1.p1  ORF type:complete len:242 (+),score=57.33 TRINITY_DN3137_c0_g2_i1:760-1485(+)